MVGLLLRRNTSQSCGSTREEKGLWSVQCYACLSDISTSSQKSGKYHCAQWGGKTESCWGHTDPVLILFMLGEHLLHCILAHYSTGFLLQWKDRQPPKSRFWASWCGKMSPFSFPCWREQALQALLQLELQPQLWEIKTLRYSRSPERVLTWGCSSESKRIESPLQETKRSLFGTGRN